MVRKSSMRSSSSKLRNTPKKSQSSCTANSDLDTPRAATDYGERYIASVSEKEKKKLIAHFGHGWLNSKRCLIRLIFIKDSGVDETVVWLQRGVVGKVPILLCHTFSLFLPVYRGRKMTSFNVNPSLQTRFVT